MLRPLMSLRVVVSGGASWANEDRAPTRLAAPTDENVERKRRRLCVDCITVLLSLEFSIGHVSPTLVSPALLIETRAASSLLCFRPKG